MARGGPVTAELLQNAKLRVVRRMGQFVLVDLLSAGGKVIATLEGWTRVAGSAARAIYQCRAVGLGLELLRGFDGPLIEDSIDLVVGAGEVAVTETRLIAQQMHGGEGYVPRAAKAVKSGKTQVGTSIPGAAFTAAGSADSVLFELATDVVSQAQQNRATAARATAAREDALLAKVTTAQTPSQVALGVLGVAHSVLSDAAGYTLRLPQVKLWQNPFGIWADHNNRSNLEEAQRIHLKEQLGRASNALSVLQRSNVNASPAGAKLATTLKHIIAATKFALKETRSAEAYTGERDVPGYAGIQAELTEANHLVQVEARQSFNQGQSSPAASSTGLISNS